MDRRRCGGATLQLRRPSNRDGFAVAGLFADGETIIQDAECIRESYPGFEIALDEFINHGEFRTSTPVIGTLVPATPVEE